MLDADEEWLLNHLSQYPEKLRIEDWHKEWLVVDDTIPDEGDVFGKFADHEDANSSCWRFRNYINC